jgi:hypothetical protein
MHHKTLCPSWPSPYVNNTDILSAQYSRTSPHLPQPCQCGLAITLSHTPCSNQLTQLCALPFQNHVPQTNHPDPNTHTAGIGHGVMVQMPATHIGTHSLPFSSLPLPTLAASKTNSTLLMVGSESNTNARNSFCLLFFCPLLLWCCG